MFEQVTRHVAGHNDEGKSLFVDQREISPIEVALYPGAQTWQVWGTEDGFPRVGKNDESVHKPYFPGPGGSRIHLFEFAPNQAAGNDAGAGTSAEELEAMKAEAEAVFPGLFGVHAADPVDAAFHTTDSIDYALVIRGEVVLQLDDGVEQVLTPGSFVVQRGTRHAWVNRSDETALLLFVVLGATRA